MNVHLLIVLQIIVQHIHAYSQVTIVKWIVTIPALGAKLASLSYDRMKIAKRKENHLEFGFFGAHFQRVLIKVVQCFVHVGLHASWRLVCDLYSRLQNALRYDVSEWIGGGLGRDEYAKILVRILAMLLQEFLQRVEPIFNQMYILQHDPVASLGSRVHSSFGHHLLTLTEGNIVKVKIVRSSILNILLLFGYFLKHINVMSHFCTMVHYRYKKSEQLSCHSSQLIYVTCYVSISI